jgi:hypothetical protein
MCIFVDIAYVYPDSSSTTTFPYLSQVITSPHVNGHYPGTRGVLRSLNDTHLGSIASLVIPKQESLDHVCARQGYPETKSVRSETVSTEHS